MDRIVVRIESKKNVKPKITSLELAIPPIAFAILVATTNGSNRSLQYLWLAEYAIIIISFIILWIVCIAITRNTRRQLKEAAVKVTPRGVQLLSIYNTQSESKVGNDVFEIRAFIPTWKIIDVIVTEVVWPHCVWSQVAFRVLKDSTSNSQSSSTAYSTKDETERECDDIKQIMQKKQQQPVHNMNIHELLQQNRVEIMPCFPDEYRGCLTYEMCLDIQEAIDKMLFMPSRS